MRLYTVNNENEVSRKYVYEEIRSSGFILRPTFILLIGSCFWNRVMLILFNDRRHCREIQEFH